MGVDFTGHATTGSDHGLSSRLPDVALCAGILFGTLHHLTNQGDFMKHLLTFIALAFALSMGSAHAADAAAACAAKSAEKKLAGAAKTSFEKKCIADAGAAPAAMAASPACEKSAADKKLAGAAKSSHIKKCMADEKAGAKPAAATPKK
jgi:hypothetical protein